MVNASAALFSETFCLSLGQWYDKPLTCAALCLCLDVCLGRGSVGVKREFRFMVWKLLCDVETGTQSHYLT